MLPLDQAARVNYVPPPPRTSSPTTSQVDIEAVANLVVQQLEPRIAALEQQISGVATKQDLVSMLTELKQLLPHKETIQQDHTIQPQIVPQPLPSQTPQIAHIAHMDSMNQDGKTDFNLSQ